MSNHNLLNSFQSGFRSGHSTTTALVRITDDIRLGMDNQQVTVLTLLDFSKAFNTVDFDVLLAVLSSLNISPKVIGWFHSYLRGRRQRVQIQDTFYDWSVVKAGVPQGGVLSPLLFSIFINSICSDITSLYHKYADDLQIYFQCKIAALPNTIRLINEDLIRIYHWCNSFGLKVNQLKTQAIIIGSSKLISRLTFSLLPPVIFEGTLIPYSDKVKNLGIMFDRTLSWGPQVSEVSRRMFAAVGSLRRLRNFLPIPTKVALAQSLLLPILDYADTCYLDLTVDQLNKLERLQNYCIKFIFGLRKYDHISEFRHKLKWLPIRFRRNTHILHLLYCILFNPTTPSYLKDRFIYLSSLHSLPLRSQNNLLSTPRHSSSFYSNSFTVTAIRLWNSLPLHIKECKSLPIFKNKLKLYYLSS
ncbi:unnamed protein product [Parnassius mnemosyne]|uniref:Reverse transcriptase domain-containing protein n=1 Tax=Parnassius mnemosyne TaxID=213953 RepID=A0AAV1L6Q7_9NEOP